MQNVLEDQGCREAARKCSTLSNAAAFMIPTHASLLSFI